MMSWASLGRALPANQERWSFFSTPQWWDHTWSAVSSPGLHQYLCFHTQHSVILCFCLTPGKEAAIMMSIKFPWTLLSQAGMYHNSYAVFLFLPNSVMNSEVQRDGNPFIREPSVLLRRISSILCLQVIGNNTHFLLESKMLSGCLPFHLKRIFPLQGWSQVSFSVQWIYCLSSWTYFVRSASKLASWCYVEITNSCPSVSSSVSKYTYSLHLQHWEILLKKYIIFPSHLEERCTGRKRTGKFPNRPGSVDSLRNRYWSAVGDR